jgi:hypothetical protein
MIVPGTTSNPYQVHQNTIKNRIGSDLTHDRFIRGTKITGAHTKSHLPPDY